MNLLQEAREVNELHGRLQYLERALQDNEATVKDTTETHNAVLAAQEILQLVAQAVQQRAHEKISAVVSSCLRTVFQDPYEFHIEFERKRGRTEARMRFIRRDLSVDPLSASGGGVVDVAAFALRVSCLMLHRPRLRRLVVLDEPFKFVSEQYRDNVRQMLEELSRDLKLQIVMVTHVNELETGKVIKLK
jgi:DNA repair exonuclease SbcCD ATPase subunit